MRDATVISFTLHRWSLFAADVSLEVEGEVVGASKRAVAVEALERPGTGVLAVVSRELVGASKAPLTPFPRARVRLFPRVRALVCLEVGALGVHLLAAGVVAFVEFLGCISCRSPLPFGGWRSGSWGRGGRGCHTSRFLRLRQWR